MTLLTKSKPLFIINPLANEKRAPKEWKKVQRYLDDWNISYDAESTKSRKEAVEIVRKDTKHKMIIVVGGDGGMNAVVEGAMKNNLEKILGVIPAGTANDLAKIFDIYSTPKKLPRILLEEYTREADVGVVNDNYFLAHASIGFPSLTLQERDKRCFLKGKLAYFAGALRALLKYSSNRLRIKSGKNYSHRSAFLAVVSNLKYYADGMEISPFAKPDDELLDLCLIEGKSNLGLVLRNLPLVYSGTHVKNPEVIYEQSKTFEISGLNPLLLQADGDIIGEYENLKFSIAERKLKMLCSDFFGKGN